MILPLILLLTFYAIIYAWMTISLCGSVASIIAIIYCLLERYYILSIFIFLVLFFCVALLRFFIIHIGSINQDIIKKSARKWWEALCALWKHWYILCYILLWVKRGVSKSITPSISIGRRKSTAKEYFSPTTKQQSSLIVRDFPFWSSKPRRHLCWRSSTPSTTPT